MGIGILRREIPCLQARKDRSLIRVKERAPRPSRLEQVAIIRTINMRLLIASALAILSCNALAAERMSYREAEYLISCAVCFGLKAGATVPWVRC